MEGGRLAWYLDAADAAFWDQHWQPHFAREAYAAAERGELGWYERPFTRFLPRQGRILEAGCGMGQYVLALRRRGYEAEGVDFADETVRRIGALYPDLPVRQGDAMALDVPDGHYAGYVSLGVVEHRHEGPEPFLREAWRVLAPGGVALVSVPQVNVLRRLKGSLGFYREDPGPRAFYQFAFPPAGFESLLEGIGFRCEARFGYDSYKGIFDELPPLRRLLARQVGRYSLAGAVQGLLRRVRPLEQAFGHMLLLACRKPALPA